MSTNDHEDLTYAMEELADRQAPAGPPPTAELVRRGRLRKRQRAAVLTGGVAAVAAVAMAGAFVVGGGSGSPTATGIGPAAAASGTGTPTGSPSGKPTSTSSPIKPSDTHTAGPPIASLLAERLPAGFKILNSWDYPGAKPGSGLWLVGAAHNISNGSQSGSMRLELTQLRDVPAGSTNYKPTADCGPALNCTVTHRPDGSVLIVSLPPKAAGGEQDWSASLYGTDGGLVTASSGNIAGPGQGGGVYGGGAVLTGEQLTALALDPVWQGIIQKH
ncbi:hypothetical protein [Kitasatospora griseola]|uniref:hypothetical protein n=1 Tax=Kitasatospora griseola TaxID=2064 RepID=UPI00380AE6A2